MLVYSFITLQSSSFSPPQKSGVVLYKQENSSARKYQNFLALFIYNEPMLPKSSPPRLSDISRSRPAGVCEMLELPTLGIAGYLTTNVGK